MDLRARADTDGQIEHGRARSLPFRGEFQQNVSNVLAGRHKKAVPDARRNVDDIAYSERLRLATSERGPKIFAGRRTPSPLCTITTSTILSCSSGRPSASR